jgi:outer membrane protein TolC
MPVHTMPTHFSRRLDRLAGPLRRSALSAAVACLAASLGGCVALPSSTDEVQASSGAAAVQPAVWGDPPARAVHDRHAAAAGSASQRISVPVVTDVALAAPRPDADAGLATGTGAAPNSAAGPGLLRRLLARQLPGWVESDSGSPSANTGAPERAASTDLAVVGDGSRVAADGLVDGNAGPAAETTSPAADAATPAAGAAGEPAVVRPRGLAAVKSLARQGNASPADAPAPAIASEAAPAPVQAAAPIRRLPPDREPGQATASVEPAEALAAAAGAASPPASAASAASEPPAALAAAAAAVPPAGAAASAASAPGGQSLAPLPVVSSNGSPLPQPRLDMLHTLLGLPTVLPMHPASPGRPAEPVPDGAALRLYDAAVGTARQSPEVTAAELRLESFGQTRRAAFGALLPQVTVRTAGGRGITRSVDPTSILYRLDAMASVRQSLIDRPAGLEVQRQDLLTGSATEQLRDADSKALLDGGLAFLGVLQARVGLSLGEQYETRLAELARYIGERAAAGGTSQAEADRLRARVANVRSTLADTRAQLLSALRNMERLYGNVPPALSMAGVEAINVPGGDDEAVAAALLGNAELAAARLEISAAGLERGIARARSSPKLEFELTHTRARNASGTSGETNDIKGMLVLSLNAYDGGTSTAQAGAADARRRELEARATATERRLRFEIQSAYANLEASSQRFVSVREELDGNQRVVQAFQAQLVGNGRPLLDVLDAYQRHYQSQLDLTQVLVATAQSQWRLAHLMGSLSMQLGQPAAR